MPTCTLQCQDAVTCATVLKDATVYTATVCNTWGQDNHDTKNAFASPPHNWHTHICITLKTSRIVESHGKTPFIEIKRKVVELSH